MKTIFLALTALATVSYAETFHNVEFALPETVQNWTKTNADSTTPEGTTSHVAMYMDANTKEVFTVVTIEQQTTTEELETGFAACAEQLKTTLVEKDENSALYSTNGSFGDTEVAGWMRILSSESGTAVLSYQTVGGGELNAEWIDVLKGAHCL